MCARRICHIVSIEAAEYSVSLWATLFVHAVVDVCLGLSSAAGHDRRSSRGAAERSSVHVEFVEYLSRAEH